VERRQCSRIIGYLRICAHQWCQQGVVIKGVVRLFGRKAQLCVQGTFELKEIFTHGSAGYPKARCITPPER
jgi:hypothetical protein